MATGPRFRHRSLERPGGQPDYLLAGQEDADPWRRLDDDIYKFLQFRKPQLGQSGIPPSYQFLAEIEVQLKKNRPDYELGAYLGLVRLAADLDQTGSTFVTASERGALHALWRRASHSKKADEHFDPRRVARFESLLAQNEATTLRGLADLMRLVSRAAKLPLMGNAQHVPALSVASLMQITELAVNFNQATLGKLEFQVSPMDVFLGARSVLFNRSVAHPTLSLLRELVLEEGGLYHDDLLEWLHSVGTFGSELTLLIPDSLCLSGYHLPGGRFSALEMVSAGGARLIQAPSHTDKTLQTLSDALIHRIQKQDQHKDYQIQVLLNHFNQLLQGERRSAARVSAERKQARFDYMEAIRRAGNLAQQLQTGEYRAMAVPADEGASPQAVATLVSPHAAPSYEQPDPPARPKAESFSREVLAEWDATIQRVRQRVSAKSPIFKSMVAQIAKVRSLDICLAHGLTPGGSRCIGRFSRIIQGEELFPLLGLDDGAREAVQSALGSGDAAYLSSLESLIVTLYGFHGRLENIQFRYRDRIGDPSEPLSRAFDSNSPQAWGEESALDQPLIGLILNVIAFEETAANRGGKMGGEEAEAPTGNPFVAFLALLTARRDQTGNWPGRDTEALWGVVQGMQSEEKAKWLSCRDAYRHELGGQGKVIPLLQSSTLRPGWYLGCERGYMKEIREVVEEGENDFDRRLLVKITEVQGNLDRLCEDLEKNKATACRTRLKNILGN